MTFLSKLSFRPSLLGLLIGASTLAGAAGGVALANSDTAAENELTAMGPAAVARAGAHSSLADMVEAVGPSVVQIKVVAEGRLPRQGDLPEGFADPREQWREFFGFDIPQGQAPQAREALGSGFIIDASGIVLTNNHVVSGADHVTVQLSDGRELAGRVLGRDDKTDVAVVKIEGDGPFPAVRWGDSDRIRVGDSIFAVGSPFGLGNTVTSGIVSARGREIGAGPYDDFLQVDAAINSGNSGGPLFDANGRVVGVNTAIYSPSGGNVGIGFAIPAQLAQQVANQIVQNGSVSRGRIGVALQDLTPQLASELGLSQTEGAMIREVEPGGPAAQSGVQPGDVVRRFGARVIDDGGDLARAVAGARVGSSIPVQVMRNGRQVDLSLSIGSDTRAS